MARTDEVTKILRAFAESADELLKKHSEQFKKNNITYSTSVADEKNTLLKKEYTAKLEELREQYTKFIDDTIKNIVSREKEKILIPLPEQDGIYLRDMTRSQNISLSEFEIMVEKYRDNYSAVKMLADIAQNNNIKFSPVHIDAKLTRAENVRQYAAEFMTNYSQPSDIDSGIVSTNLKSSLILDGMLESDMNIVTGPYIYDTQFEKDYN